MNALTIQKWCDKNEQALDFILTILDPYNVHKYGIPIIASLEQKPQLRGQRLANMYNITCKGDLDVTLAYLTKKL